MTTITECDPLRVIEIPEFIREHLAREGEDYTYQAWKIFRKKLQAIGQEVPSYVKFLFKWRKLARSHLIEFARAENTGRVCARQYYRLVEANINSEKWNNGKDRGNAK